ncbi:MAG: hypothetical protein A3J37_01415 [Alphaproteobacteria bacterium RIFCSPHIGHO2_12_FULL_45_9]|nr:MAG: hypothetical protein A3J37_01415 [Alphaproteobacteria bacterium RIFCSPHIGHO2_12_FULL_45_9]
MSPSQEKISVIVAAYNAEKTLLGSVQSVLNQTHTALEVIIVDDQSKDSTLTLAQELAKMDARVKVIAAEKNGGPARARNAALDVATGDWVAIVDSDDVILPERFQAMLDVAQQTNADIIFDNLFYVTPHNGAEHLYIPKELPVFGALSLSTFIKSHRKSVDIPNLGFLKPMIRRSKIEQSHLRYDPALKIGEDAMLIMDLMAMGATATLMSDAYYRYHRHDGSISAVQGMDSVAAITNGYQVYLTTYHGQINDEVVEAMTSLIHDNQHRLAVGNIVDDLCGARALAGLKSLVCTPRYAFPVVKSIAGRLKRDLRSR